MKYTLLSSISLACLATLANAQVTTSQVSQDNGNGTYTVTTVDCFTYDVTGGSPLNTAINNLGNFTFNGNLTNGTYSSGMSNISITSQVFSSAGSTTASYGNGMITFTGTVGFLDDASTATGFPSVGSASNSISLDCKGIDFSFTKCTTIDEGSSLFREISDTRGFYGVAGDERNSVVANDAFKYNERTKKYEYDSSKSSATVDSKDPKASTFWYYTTDKDGKKVVTEYERSTLNSGSNTVLKDFKVCTQCTEVFQVPEPSSTLLLGLAGLAGLARRKR